MVVEEGGVLKLRIELNKANQEVTWFKKDLEIIPKVDKRFRCGSKGVEHTLEMEGCSLEDAGEIAVEVANLSSVTKLSVTSERGGGLEVGGLG